jgi:hypothetical protein
VTQSHRHPILHSGLFFSPQKSFQLPAYAEAAAQAYVHSLSPSYDSDHFSGDRRVLQYLDISADEDNDELEEYFLDVSDDASVQFLVHYRPHLVVHLHHQPVTL